MNIEYKYYCTVNNDFEILTNELDIEFSIKNRNKQEMYNKYNKLNDIKDIIIVYDNQNPIGCGAIKKYDNSRYEVKRVYVKNEYRGNGISKVIMKQLEEIAKEKGIRILILETSKTFVEAINLYKKIGYIQIDNYRQYKDMELSVCMEKRLD
jgi:N-acetylglutamate synthase-like GNAT family acetyltransferase